MDNKDVNDFLEPVFDLTISRVWRGHGPVFFVELGETSGEDSQGQYTLWIDTCFWKLNSAGKVCDGNEDDYDTIDKEIQKLVNQKISKIDFLDKAVNIAFTDGVMLKCIPNGKHLVSIILNSNRKCLNFESDGTILFKDGKS